MRVRRGVVVVVVALAALRCGPRYAGEDEVAPPIRDAASDAPADGADSTAEAEAVSDASSADVDAADGASCCDCDGDGYEIPSCLPAIPPDCDDTNAKIHPNQDFVGDPWTSTHTPVGDWNCDGKVEKKTSEYLQCGAAPPCGGQGFSKTVGCGTSDYLLTCTQMGSGCVKLSGFMQAQACR